MNNQSQCFLKPQPCICMFLMIQLIIVMSGKGSSEHYSFADCCCPAARMAFIILCDRPGKQRRRPSFSTLLRRRPMLAPSSSASSSSSSSSASSSNYPHSIKSTLPTAEDVGLQGLYPPSVAYRNGTLSVDELHTLYYEEHGRWHDDGKQQQQQQNESKHFQNEDKASPPPAASPPLLHALFLHGGPGAGCTPNHARFFNPHRYHIVLLDQRGAGKSRSSSSITTTTTITHTPPRGVDDNNDNDNNNEILRLLLPIQCQRNTLQHLIQDCELLRQHLQIPAWDVILGGSFGVTLAVAYAQTHPTKVHSLILRGVCLMRTCEIDWLFSSSNSSSSNSSNSSSIAGMDATPQRPKEEMTATAARLFPDAWQAFANAVNSTNSYPRETLHRYYDRILGQDPIVRLETARSWMMWEMTVFAGTSSSSSSNVSSSSSSSSSSAAARFYQKAYAPVAVYKPEEQHKHKNQAWTLQDGQGHVLNTETRIKLGLQYNNTTCQDLVEQLRQNLTQQQVVAPKMEYLQPKGPRPIRQLKAIATTVLSSNNVTQQQQQQQAANFVPAQIMLTCFYSVNEHYTKNYVDLLDPQRMQRIQHIPCIAVHGGLDRVCPVDTALDLLQHWSSKMELRIPLQSGHSMYDVAVTNELVRATDRMALVLTNRQMGFADNTEEPGPKKINNTIHTHIDR